MDWEPADLLAWLRAHPPDVNWLERPGRHQYRWRDARGAWHTAGGRVSTPERLVRLVSRHPPRDLYVGTASWLDPVGLPRLRDVDVPPPLLLDHLVVFDVDASPWSLRRLDAAREATRALLDWMARETDLRLVHVTFSGAKGFHVAARDPDRAPFAVPDPRAREAAVREARRALLRRALDAGHPVDPTVTADTRRVIRLPGSLHGGTGWACTVLPPAWLDRPVRAWLPEVPRHARSRMPPAFALPRVPRLSAAALVRRLRRAPAAAATAPSRLELQASTHVPGTRDREALLAWLPPRVDAASAERALAAARLGPGLLWGRDGRLLLLVPRALPRARLARLAPRLGLARLASALDARGHAWVAVGPARWSDGAQEAEPQPAGLVPAASESCAHPWSRAHLDLARRLGQPVPDALLAAAGGGVAGSGRARLRLAEIR